MRANDLGMEPKKIDVQLTHEAAGVLGSGTFHYGGDRWAHVSFSWSQTVPAALAEGSKFDLVKAVTEDGQVFSLCACKVQGYSLYADYVIEADLNSTSFDSISVQYHDVSEWFLHWQNIDGEVGKTLTWKRVPEGIDVTVRTDGDHFGLRSEIIGSRRQQGEDVVLHERVEFVFTAEDNAFGLDDLKAKSHELSCLLSILMMYPATIAAIKVSQDSEHYVRVHFPTSVRPERDLQDSGFWLRCFIQQPWLEGEWQSIANRYYESRYRKVVWSRVAGMLRYEGFWEYKVFGYVSLLDSYLDIRFEGTKPTIQLPPARKKIDRFRRNLATELPAVTQELREQVVEIASRSFASIDDSFEDRFRKAAAEMDTDIAKIVNLSDEDFKFIREIRNKIAHGDDHGLEADEFPRVVRTEGKIALLLTYFAFLDLGVTPEKFVKCLSSTHNSLRFAAMLDDIHLSRVNRSAEFFPVTMEKLEHFRTIKSLRVYGCCVQNADGDLDYSQEFTKIYANWRSDLPRSLGLQTPERIFGLSQDDARMVGQGYFECGEERVPVTHMWIIKHEACSENQIGDRPDLA
ncbi:hypothetical protein FSO04_43905 [Paraburkholderia madseniana]|uniref:ApeA N-terminal domain-containing protein n=2 Tax=Paraburkholderia madseniana TaxID=2599607 RepID=A0A6N6VYK7_9BURK|nr:hypothetical protein FSO04_43905 [Paraburkholderia madseniana]